MAGINVTPEVINKRSEGIRKAKASPEHRQRMSNITKNLWATGVLKHNGAAPWNKLSNDKKIEKQCPVCNKKFFVVPAHSIRKSCSRQCANQYKRTTPHINWNPKSLVGTGYSKTLRGIYQGLHFRSSYELAVLHELISEGKQVSVEPFFIWYEFEGRSCRYFPDILVNGKTILEVKPTKMLDKEQNKLKLKALEDFCSNGMYDWKVITEKDITFLTDVQIQSMIDAGVVVITKGAKPCFQKIKQNKQAI